MRLPEAGKVVRVLVSSGVEIGSRRQGEGFQPPSPLNPSGRQSRPRWGGGVTEKLLDLCVPHPWLWILRT